MKRDRIIRIFPYIGLVLGVAAIVVTILKAGYLAGMALAVVPLILYGILFSIKTPHIAYTGLFIANYFVLGVSRYVPGLPGGVVIDCLIMFNVFILLLRACYKKVEWGRAANGLTLVALIWLVYCILQITNPESLSTKAWFTSIRSYAIYFFVIAILTPIIFYRYRDLKRILAIWSVLTLLAVLKAWGQRTFGFDTIETHWLFVEGGYTTHIIRSGVRYFSFFSDAANFGASMGLSMVVFAIAAFQYRQKNIRYYYLGVAAVACYGLLISGTRSAMAVPFAGYALYILMSRHVKVILLGTLVVAGAFFFLNNTHIGQGNALIRRARSAFNPKDRSFQVRLENQERMRSYMAQHPFGAGLGHGGGKAKEFAPDAYLSQIPTDSWFVMVWVETGLVGLLLHVAILLYIVGHGVYLVMFRLKDPQLKGLTGALTAGCFGIMVASYSNEIYGQFPTGIIMYMSQVFIFISPSFDREIAKQKEAALQDSHEQIERT